MSEPPVHLLKINVREGVLVLTISEPRLDSDKLSDKVRQELLAIVTASGNRKVVIDLQNVEYLSSAAFRPLLSLRRKLQETGGQMVLCQLTANVRKVFEDLKLISINQSFPATFDVQPDVRSAIAFVNARA
jgi:anti-anti-sigma factor